MSQRRQPQLLRPRLDCGRGNGRNRRGGVEAHVPQGSCPRSVAGLRLARLPSCCERIENIHMSALRGKTQVDRYAVPLRAGFLVRGLDWAVSMVWLWPPSRSHSARASRGHGTIGAVVRVWNVGQRRRWLRGDRSVAGLIRPLREIHLFFVLSVLSGDLYRAIKSWVAWCRARLARPRIGATPRDQAAFAPKSDLSEIPC